VPPEGCADGVRSGFVDYAMYHDIAACGAPVSYTTARSSAAVTCETGWHQCVPYSGELSVLLATAARPAERFDAWLHYDDPACNIHEQFVVGGCGGSVAQFAHFQGTGGCHPSGTCGEGYRPMLSSGPTWDWSLRGGGVGGPCTNHITYACAHPGGTVPAHTALTACCRD
jgi:hypothetical protein